MKHAVTRELHAYWSRLRGTRAAPERQDIDPAAIRTILSDTFILEVGPGDAERDYAIRLSGARFNALFMRELKGRSLLSLWPTAERAGAAGLIGTVVDDCTPLVAGLRAGPEGHRPIDLELLLLPLKHHGRTHARVLGAIAPVEVPTWLGLLPVQHLSVSTFRLVGADAVSTFGMARAAAGPSPRHYGRFTVHEGGRMASQG